MHKNVKRAATAALAAGALVVPLAAPATAATPSDPLVEGLIGPLGVSVGPHGDIYVSEAFAGLLSRVDAARDKAVVAEAQNGMISGVYASRSSQRVYLTAGENEEGPYAQLRRHDIRGRTHLVADLHKWEVEQNPDAEVHYGFSTLPADCASQVPEWIGGGEGYDGIVESNPYGVTNVPGGWVVADAAANALISVRRNGQVSTLAVLPAHTLTLTQAHVEAVNAGLPPAEPGQPEMQPLPGCVVGHDYAFEPVPTDVALGPDGKVYVTTLAGGPEDPSLGARSKVFSVDRRGGGGTVTELGSGFAGATNIAVAPDGSIYVAELFGGQVSKLVNKAPETVAEVPFPSAVDWYRGSLYATVDVFNEETGGSLVTIPVAGV